MAWAWKVWCRSHKDEVCTWSIISLLHATVHGDSSTSREATDRIISNLHAIHPADCGMDLHWGYCRTSRVMTPITTSSSFSDSGNFDKPHLIFQQSTNTSSSSSPPLDRFGGPDEGRRTGNRLKVLSVLLLRALDHRIPGCIG